jgi:putative peptidoglycan lipid II flippase
MSRLKLALVGSLGVVGLALATSVGAWVNVAAVWLLAVRRKFSAPSRTLGKALAATAIGCALLTAFVLLARAPLAAGLAPLGPLAGLATLGALATGGIVLYAGAFLGSARLLRLRLGRA